MSGFAPPARPAFTSGEPGRSPFEVVGLFTASHRSQADQLRETLATRGLDFELFEVPNVHDSISPSGAPDSPCTKPHFIAAMLERHRRPVLYLDADVLVREPPKRIAALAGGDVDFAVYNWLADEHTDAFVPMVTDADEPGAPPRFYRFSRSVDAFAPDQLVCSGAVQFHAPTAGARGLLAAWARAIERFPGVPDDECLDFAFNGLAPGSRPRVEWLDKAYIRCGFWIYVKPVIDHPEIPAGQKRRTIEEAGAVRWNPRHAEIRRDARMFPRDAILDLRERVVLRPTGTADSTGDRVDYAPFAPLWQPIYRPERRG